MCVCGGVGCTYIHVCLLEELVHHCGDSNKRSLVSLPECHSVESRTSCWYLILVKQTKHLFLSGIHENVHVGEHFEAAATLSE